MRKKICILFVVIMLIFSLFNITPVKAAERPSTIDEFITKYKSNIDAIINEEETVETLYVNKPVEDAKEQQPDKVSEAENIGNQVNNAINNANVFIKTLNSQDTSPSNKNERIAEEYISRSVGLEQESKFLFITINSKSEPMVDYTKDYSYLKEDYPFVAYATVLAVEYIKNSDASEDLENNSQKDENGNIDYAKTFDQLVEKYKNAKTKQEKATILAQMDEIMVHLTPEQLDGEVDGQKRVDIFETYQKEVNEEYNEKVYGEIDKSTGIAGVEERNKTTDQIVSDANDFVSNADISNTVDQQDFEEGISKIYNILFAIGMVIAVIWGVILGIKFLYDSTEGKAEIKEQLLPYVIGVFIIFGAFGIWKIVLEIMKIVA